MNPFVLPRSPMRVAFIDDVQPMADAHQTAGLSNSQRMEGLAKGLARLGHFIDIYRPSSPGQPVWEDLYAGVRVHRVADMRRWPMDDQTRLSQAVYAFADKVRHMVMHVYPCDAVHAWGPFAGLVGLRLTRGVAMPFVFNMRPSCTDALPLVDMAESDAIKALIAQRADRLIADSEEERGRLIEEHDAASEKVCVIPPGVDPHVFKPRAKAQARQELGLPPDAFIVVWGGKPPLDAMQGRAMTPFLRAMHKARAHVVMQGSTREALAVACAPDVSVMNLRAQGQDPQIRLSMYLAAADVLVLPQGKIDAEGINPREAMACGTPVVAMNVSEHDEVAGLVQEGVTGHLLRRARPEALQAHLQSLREEPHRRSAMGMAAVLRARTFFTWDKVAERFVHVYTEARLPSRVRLQTRSLTLIRGATHEAAGHGGLVPVGA